MIRITAKIPRLLNPLKFNFSNYHTPSLGADTSGIANFMQSSNTASLSISEKLSYLTPGSMYSCVDEFSRELLFTLSVDGGLGVGLSIFTVTVLLKLVFTVPTLKGMSLGERQQEMKEYTDKYKEKLQTARMSNNSALMSQAGYQYKMNLRKKGFSTNAVVFNMFQIPFLISWFLSLRYIANLPEVYPQMLYEGLFWFKDLSAADPYYVLPFVAAAINSLAFSKSPIMNSKNVSPISKMIKPQIKSKLKFLPFCSLLFTMNFPACLTFYWLLLASSHLANIHLVKNQYVKKWLFNIPIAQKKVKKFDKIVLVDQKFSQSQKANEGMSKIAEKKMRHVKLQPVQLSPTKPKKKQTSLK